VLISGSLTGSVIVGSGLENGEVIIMVVTFAGSAQKGAKVMSFLGLGDQLAWFF
jgi:hypothetical protein